MPSPVLTVTLNPAVDKTIGPGTRKRAKLSAGGKGINVSRALKILGVKSTATGLAGGDAGNFIRSALKKERIEGRFAAIRGESRVNLTVIGPGGKMSRRIEKGPAVSAREFADFKKLFLSLLKGRKYVVFSGANANGLEASAYAQLIRMAKRRGVITVLDTRDAALREGLKAGPDIVKPNLEEARAAPVEKAGIVLLTMGSRGAKASCGREAVTVRPPKVMTVNAVGCGDAFLAGYIAYRLKGGDFASSVKAGAAAGTAKAKSLVPGSFNKRDFKWSYSRVKAACRTR